MEEEEKEGDEVFTVELHRGPHGLGLALVDGMVGEILVFIPPPPPLFISFTQVSSSFLFLYLPFLFFTSLHGEINGT